MEKFESDMSNLGERDARDQVLLGVRRKLQRSLMLGFNINAINRTVSRLSQHLIANLPRGVTSRVWKS